MASQTENLNEQIKAEASSLGFVLCGFSEAHRSIRYDRYLRWLEEGCHAGMGYMARPEAILKREHPAHLLEDCQTVISLAMAYAPIKPNRAEAERRPKGRIAVYAAYPDYHDLMRKALAELAAKLTSLSRSEAFVAVDTSPILEKSFGHQAGLGWVGRNSLVINPKYGSWLFLGEVLTTARFESDSKPMPDGCRDCRRCVMACPTRAIGADRSIDARRCLSYLTIEHRGSIPEAFREMMGDRIFGCDTCQTACPYNRAVEGLPSPAMSSQVIDPFPDLIESLRLTEGQFKERYAGTAVLRAGYAGWRRNVAIALGNSGQDENVPVLEEVLSENQDHVVREAVLWALKHLGR